MSKQLKSQDSTRYYLQTDLWRLLGAGMMIVGVVWFYFGFSSASYYVPTVITPVGLILFLIFSGRHVSDRDIEEEMEHRLTDYDKPVTDRADYSRVILKQPADVETEAYHMGKEAAFFKKNKPGRTVSDVYVKTHVFFTNHALLICARQLRMSLARDAAGAAEDFEWALSYEDLVSAQLCENVTAVALSNTKKQITVKWYELVLSGEEGEILRLPVNNDMDMSDLCDHVNRKIQQQKKEG
ncbi:MAG: hypothetical protein E7645_07600 [Ruminococcaceae bacterium]|nr:hypothetical protein [Oscillospiraceae bacterium]